MSSIADARTVSTPDMTEIERLEYESWVRSYETGAFDDEAPGEHEMPDWEPEPEDAAWWAAEVAHLESQRPNCLGMPLTLAELDDRLQSARRRLGVISAELAEHVAYGRME
jgi:hypothetical protein